MKLSTFISKFGTTNLKEISLKKTITIKQYLRYILEYIWIV